MSAKVPARLSNDLLSRKGMATPSAGPETRINMVGPLGAPPPGRLTPALLRDKLADWIAPEHRSRKRIRVSLRLDEDRHARLKLVAAQRDCTLQSIFTQAIDEYFERHAPDLKDMTARLRKGVSRGKRNTEVRNGSSRTR